jgi:hypothetical protein
MNSCRFQVNIIFTWNAYLALVLESYEKIMYYPKLRRYKKNQNQASDQSHVELKSISVSQRFNTQ